MYKITEIRFRVVVRSRQDDIDGALWTGVLSACDVLLQRDSACGRVPDGQAWSL